MSYQNCPRLGLISAAQCSQTVLSTTDKDAYAVCLGCRHGIAKAASSPIKPRDTRHAASMSLHAASRVLPRTLGFVIDNHPGNERVTMGYLAQVAHRFGFDGGPLPLALAAREAKLDLSTLGGQQAVVLNGTAKIYAQAQA